MRWAYTFYMRCYLHHVECLLNKPCSPLCSHTVPLQKVSKWPSVNSWAYTSTLAAFVYNEAKSISLENFPPTSWQDDRVHLGTEPNFAFSRVWLKAFRVQSWSEGWADIILGIFQEWHWLKESISAKNSAVVWFYILCKLAEQRLELGHLCIVCQSYIEPPVIA